ncbi:aspartate/glutamate racemase family protein [Acuticoccus sp. MNP-M23]|uniref:aspartate/glutamate racemase family protein n=1 Tax=Acuticoccus sp. MNP-M23 TaxID=3072793 RepID=UPI002815F1CB|nr:aspartate/glutamate racemase family protein [Acuticoccus sp. MNP-M23]WMS44037.1 aspartate/glutamate racemase family protein [Acuticoccus sp. MNP-M23]
MLGKILLINPNSNQAVTDGMAGAVTPYKVHGGPEVECITLTTGPFGVESQADVEAVTLPLRNIVASRRDVDAFIIACFSDPGLAVCREATGAAVLGIRECAVFSALTLGDRFGVVALGPASIRRQSRAFREMGVTARWAGSAPLHMSVADAEEESAYPAVQTAAERLLEQGAEAIILGCAGMVKHRAPLARAMGVPVIDPVQAATAQALGVALLARSERETVPVMPTQLTAARGS